MPHDAFGLIGIDTETGYRSPKRVKLTVACFYLESYFINNDRDTIAKAREILENHNIELDIFPTMPHLKRDENTLAFTKEWIPHSPAAYKTLYQRVKTRLKQMGCGFIIPLPVIFGQFDHPGYAIAPKVQGEMTRLCLVSASGNPDQIDLIHEMGHAAGLGHEEAIGDPRNFMHQTNPRSTIYKYQVEAFATAPFSIG